MAKVRSDRMWLASELPKRATDVPVFISTSDYRDGVRVNFDMLFNVTLTPDEAVEIGRCIAELGAYHKIFRARYGIEERAAKVSEKDSKG